MSLPSLQPATPPDPAWWEIARPWPEEPTNWITWVAPLGDRGAAFYRTLVVADGSIAVAVEFHSRRGSCHRTIYRGRHGLPQDPAPAIEQVAERVYALLKAADEAVSKALQAERGAAGKKPDHGMASFHPADAPKSTQEIAMPARAHDPEHYLRERAYFLWEQEGRPEGRAQEFWDRASWAEAKAA